ncbi:hypothetical protein H5410_046434 [Solanum commersonii]|uniref:Zinc finger GRF-type domain-containing protein n=1 Tax=Solanum commersonii TaxID=4109 RepID=A0A9J5XGG7_SOLCO|nr:hypothetical protein H5410_046434 [Solanum commersonii]
MSSVSNSSMAFVDEGRYCRCGNEALLKTSWTQLNPGRRFLTCRISKYEDRHPPQANRIMWGWLKKFNVFDEKLKRARNIFIVGVVATRLLMFGIWKLKPNC